MLSIAAWAQGQQQETFAPLQPQAPIPDDFLVPSSDKYLMAKEELDGSEEEKRTREAKQEFLLESNFLVDMVLNSGRVLFNDPMSDYLNHIMDTLLVNEPRLRKKVRVYAVRSSVVNSFATDNGIILVNLGLIAQLETEAQLAYILCHELSHFTERHVINAYVENQGIKQGAGDYRRSTFNEKMLARSRYSKDIEKEADRIGMERFLSTPYSRSSVLNVFEVMRYAHLPFDDLPFDQNYFDQGYYKVDGSYFLNSVRPVDAVGPDRINSATHPGPTERKQLMEIRLQNTRVQSDAKDALISEQTFLDMREQARFELCNMYLNADQPVMCIYNAYLLQQAHPGHPYLRKKVAEALYTLARYKAAGNYGAVHPGYSQVEGESQQLYHMLYQMKPEELVILATGNVWRASQRYPQDEDLKNMATDLLNLLMTQFYVPGMFAKEPPVESTDETHPPDSLQSKYDRLQRNRQNDPRASMVRYALTDLFRDTLFSQHFDQAERDHWGGEAEPKSTRRSAQKQKVSLRRWKNHGFELGLEKVVVVSPVYSKMDLRKKQQHRFLKAESSKRRFMKLITRSANLLNLDAPILETTELEPKDVSTFNDITFLNQWVDKRFQQLEVGMVNMPSDELDRIIERYGTEHFTWTGVINYRESKPLMYFYLLYALIPPAIPFAVYYLVRPNFDTYYYCMTFNLRTGEPVMVNYNNFKKRDARDLINSSVYDSFWQMKTTPKEE